CSSSTISSCLCCVAHSKGVHPYLSPMHMLLLPVASSNVTIPWCLLCTANNNGVDPFMSCALTSTRSPSSSSFTTASTVVSPISAALNSGVHPSLFFKSALTSPVSSKSLTIAVCPFDTAHDSGVNP
ncbi:hypothetical protein K505DRAFT_229214, partial [Melanomma pulvis-pyrius CBS 109.77]